jgi:hypothetical protein
MSPRLVREGEVDPDNGVRESGYRLLSPFNGIPDKNGKCGGSSVSSQRLHVRYLHNLSYIVLLVVAALVVLCPVPVRTHLASPLTNSSPLSFLPRVD